MGGVCETIDRARRGNRLTWRGDVRATVGTVRGAARGEAGELELAVTGRHTDHAGMLRTCIGSIRIRAVITGSKYGNDVGVVKALAGQRASRGRIKTLPRAGGTIGVVRHTDIQLLLPLQDVVDPLDGEDIGVADIMLTPGATPTMDPPDWVPSPTTVPSTWLP